MSGGSFVNNVETNAPSDFLVTAVCWGAGLIFTAVLSWGVGLYAYRRGLWTKFMTKCRSLRTKCTSSKRASGGQEQLPNQMHQSDPPLDPLRTPGHNLQAQEVAKNGQSGMATKDNFDVAIDMPSTEVSDTRSNMLSRDNGPESKLPFESTDLDVGVTKKTKKRRARRKSGRSNDVMPPSELSKDNTNVENTDFDIGSDKVTTKTRKQRARRKSGKSNNVVPPSELSKDNISVDKKLGNSSPRTKEETHSKDKGGDVSHNQGVLRRQELNPGFLKTILQDLCQQQQKLKGGYSEHLNSALDDCVGQIQCLFRSSNTAC